VALTDEQRAMLQLLLEGGQSYEDIGSLLGITPEEVRSRARAALTEIGGADPDAQVPISDYLLGHADPIGRADAVRHLQSDPEANALAERLVAQLRLLAPKAQLPEIPPARGGRRAAAPPPPRPPEAAREPHPHPPQDRPRADPRSVSGWAAPSAAPAPRGASRRSPSASAPAPC
jgi:Sigma-70, region 4